MEDSDPAAQGSRLTALTGQETAGGGFRKLKSPRGDIVTAEMGSISDPVRFPARSVASLPPAVAFDPCGLGLSPDRPSWHGEGALRTNLAGRSRCVGLARSKEEEQAAGNARCSSSSGRAQGQKVTASPSEKLKPATPEFGSRYQNWKRQVSSGTIAFGPVVNRSSRRSS